MPTIDLPTLFLVSTALFALMAMSFLVTWYQDRRNNAAMLYWAFGHALGVPACVLLASRGVSPAWVSIGLGNFTVLLGFGLMVAGVLAFEGRRVRPVVFLAGPVIWIASTQVPLIWDHFAARVILISLMIFAHAVAAAVLIWRGRVREPLQTRGFAAGLLGLVAVTHLVRLALIFGAPLGESFATLGRGWTAFIGLQILLQTVMVAYAFLSLVKERAEFAQRRAAEVDSLTGAFTRRAFLDRASRCLAADPSRGSVLAFDLDRFKAINDTHGHRAGDRVLAVFAETVSSRISAGDIFGRLGGEEFAVFLAEADFIAAWRLADEIRRDFADLDIRLDDRSISATVSVGVAAVPLIEPDLDQLMASADAGLYAAKQGGRDRVETAAPEPALVASTGGRRLP